MRLEVQDTVRMFAHQVRRHSGDAEMGSERLDGSTADCGRASRRAGGDAQPTKDRQLGIQLALGRGRGTIGGAFCEKPLDISGPVASITTRVDAECRQAPGVGPRADRVGMDAEQRRSLGDADQRLPVFRAVASCVRHSVLLIRLLIGSPVELELLVRAVHRMLELGGRPLDTPLVPF